MSAASRVRLPSYSRLASVTLTRWTLALSISRFIALSWVRAVDRSRPLRFAIDPTLSNMLKTVTDHPRPLSLWARSRTLESPDRASFLASRGVKHRVVDQAGRPEPRRDDRERSGHDRVDRHERIRRND